MYGKAVFKKFLIPAALLMIVLPGFFAACKEPPPVIRCVPDESLLGEQQQADIAVKPTGQIPLIDAVIPNRVETATFALG